jgi:hypothetical protein
LQNGCKYSKKYSEHKLAMEYVQGAYEQQRDANIKENQAFMASQGLINCTAEMPRPAGLAKAQQSARSVQSPVNATPDVLVTTTNSVALSSSPQHAARPVVPPKPTRYSLFMIAVRATAGTADAMDAAAWVALSKEERQDWDDLFQLELAKHKIEFAKWKVANAAANVWDQEHDKVRLYVPVQVCNFVRVE